MDTIINLFSPENSIFLILLSFFLGGFVGLRREMSSQQDGSVGFAGFRTMALVSSLGCLLTLFPPFPYLPIIGFVGLLVFVAIAYSNGVFNMQLIGLTSEITTLFMYLVGSLVGFGEIVLAVFLTVLVGSLTAFKIELHSFAKTINKAEWMGVMELLVISVLILPFLPKTPIDPWGIWVPFEIWLIVIAISAISFFGYFLHKYIGGKRSVLFSAFAGSLVSSTATTIHFANLSKGVRDKKTIRLYVAALLVAITTMMARVCLVVFVLGGVAQPQLLVAPVSMMFAGLGLSLLILRQLPETNRESTDVIQKKNNELKSPFSIVPALLFGVIFSIILFAIALTSQLFGSAGVIFTTIIAATVDIDAIILSVLESMSAGTTTLFITAMAIMIGSIVNTVIKIFYIWFFSKNKRFSLEVLKYVSVVTIVGIASFAAAFLL